MQSEQEKKSAFEIMFDFIWTQPLHVTLRQMRVVQVLLIFNSQLLLWAINDSIRLLNPTESAMAYGTIAVALIAQIWKCVESFNKPAGKDDS